MITIIVRRLWFCLVAAFVGYMLLSSALALWVAAYCASSEKDQCVFSMPLIGLEINMARMPGSEGK